MTEKKALEILEAFSQYEYNWNGNGAEPFDKGVINKCRYIIEKMGFIPEIFPTANDSIQFEYKDDSFYIELEVFKDTQKFFVQVFNIPYEAEDFYVSDIDMVIDFWYTLMSMVESLNTKLQEITEYNADCLQEYIFDLESSKRITDFIHSHPASLRSIAYLLDTLQPYIDGEIPINGVPELLKNYHFEQRAGFIRWLDDIDE